MTQQIVSSLSQYCDMHPELALLLGRERSREVAGGDDVFDLRVPFGKIGDKIHFLPAILFFTVNSRKSKSLQRVALHKIESSI